MQRSIAREASQQVALQSLGQPGQPLPGDDEAEGQEHGQREGRGHLARSQQPLSDLPEMALPFLVYLLTQHPDFPEEVRTMREF
jgi:hypothetical protein